MTQSKHDKSLFSFKDPEDYGRLRHVLEAAGYTDGGVLEELGIKDFPSITESDIPLLLRRTDRGTLLDTLIRLFLIEVPVDVETVERAIRPIKLETLIDAGIVRRNGATIIAAVKLLPYQHLIVAFDLPRTLQTPIGQNYVMGVGRSTLTLANLTVRRQSRLTLDLGTGCGIQAFLAAPHSDRVLAVDLNPRAVQVAAFNANLNGMSNVECREGNLFEPVQGHTFDLVITNPPFVISPEMRYIYRDGGMQADQICQKIVREVPQFLNEGAYCQILCNWAEYAGQEWQERLRSWFEGTGCDAWVLRSETCKAGTYASTWIRHTERDDPEQFAQRLEAWVTYYEKHDIDSIGSGLITMRRAAGRANWFRADDGPENMLGPCGEHIVRGFELRDFLETVRDDSALLNSRLRVSPDVRLERHSSPSAEGWVDETVRLHLKQGLAYTGNIDPFVATMVIGCDGKQRLSDLLAHMAHSLGNDPASITPAFCNVVRGLIERGFLLPAHFAH